MASMLCAEPGQGGRARCPVPGAWGGGCGEATRSHSARVSFIRAEGPRGLKPRGPPCPPQQSMLPAPSPHPTPRCPSAPIVEINFLPGGQVIHERL